MPVQPPSNAKKAWQGQIHAAWEWPQALFDGTSATFECITRQDSASALAFLPDGSILLTEQEQPGRPMFTDVPGGRVDPGEAHLVACRRELEEETGHTAADGDWMLWAMRTHRGGMRFEQSLFVARNVKKVNDGHADAGERIKLRTVTWDELVTMCLTGKLRQSSIMYAILCMHFEPEAKKRLADWLNLA